MEQWPWVTVHAAGAFVGCLSLGTGPRWCRTVVRERVVSAAGVVQVRGVVARCPGSCLHYGQHVGYGRSRTQDCCWVYPSAREVEATFQRTKVRFPHPHGQNVKLKIEESHRNKTYYEGASTHMSCSMKGKQKTRLNVESLLIEMFTSDLRSSRIDGNLRKFKNAGVNGTCYRQ